MLLIASESVNFHTVVKEIPIREDFTQMKISLESGVKFLSLLKGTDGKC